MENKINCNYEECAAGMGVAGNLNCFLGGDYTLDICPKFSKDMTDDEIIDAIWQERKELLDQLSQKNKLIEEIINLFRLCKNNVDRFGAECEIIDGTFESAERKIKIIESKLKQSKGDERE